jgi:CheY-like chemotaxis protein
MLMEYLAFRKFHVTEARNGEEAIEVARRVRPHIILMDLSMPAMDGWEATRRLRADPLTKTTVIVAVTARALLPEQASARTAGCDAVITKPFDLAVLADALDRIVSTGVVALDAKAFTVRTATEPPTDPRKISVPTASDARRPARGSAKRRRTRTTG